MNRTVMSTTLRQIGITRRQFADLIGNSPSTINDWGGRYPVPRQARLILTMLQERGGTQGLSEHPPAALRCQIPTHPEITA